MILEWQATARFHGLGPQRCGRFRHHFVDGEPAGAGVVVVVVPVPLAPAPDWFDGVLPVAGWVPVVPGAVPVDDGEPAPLPEFVVDGLVVVEGLVLLDWFGPLPLVFVGWVDEVLLSVQPTTRARATPADSRRGFFMEDPVMV